MKFRLKSYLDVKQQIKPIQCTYYYTILMFRYYKLALKCYNPKADDLFTLRAVRLTSLLLRQLVPASNFPYSRAVHNDVTQSQIASVAQS